ncbi:hypothetical protein ACTFIU_007799 [Dictyostelium citrinum]
MSSININNTNTIQLQPPKGCDYVDLKDFLVFARKDNDNFIYEVNKIKNGENTLSECEKVWRSLEDKQLLRSQLILNCIEETKKEIESLNIPIITTTTINKNNKNNNNNIQDNSIDQTEKRKLTNKLNMLNMELEVESILTAAAKKVFHKVCK